MRVCFLILFLPIIGFTQTNLQSDISSAGASAAAGASSTAGAYYFYS